MQKINTESSINMPFTPERRQQLDDIVVKMAAQDAPREDVLTIVQDFTSKFGSEIVQDEIAQQEETRPKGLLEKTSDVSNQFLGGLTSLATGLARQTAKSAIQLPMAAAGGIAGLAGDTILERKMKSPVNVPLLGQVRQLSAIPSDVQKFGTQTPMETAGQAATMYLEAGMPGLGKLIKKPFTALAERLYQSGLKATEKGLKAGVVQTGLKERIWLTGGGIERTAQKIDDLELRLGEAIDAGKAAGARISLKGINDFVDPVRKWFYTVDIKAVKAAQKYIDTTLKTFTKKFGNDIPIEEAQLLKVNTMRYLRNAYGELSNVQAETQKQMARFLKEGIVEKAPVVGEINQRLKKLYAFDEALSKSSRRIGNLNLLGLGAKIGAAAGGKMGALLGVMADLADKPSLKTGVAIGLNEIANLTSTAGAAGRIPLVALLNYIHKNYGMDEPFIQETSPSPHTRRTGARE